MEEHERATTDTIFERLFHILQYTFTPFPSFDSALHIRDDSLGSPLPNAIEKSLCADACLGCQLRIERGEKRLQPINYMSAG